MNKMNLRTCTFIRKWCFNQSLVSFSTTSTNISQVFYDSHSTNTHEGEDDGESHSPKKPSARSEFRSIPVHKTILNSIESIGVGLRPMQNKNRYMKSIRATRRKLRNGEVLDENEEKIILRNRDDSDGDVVQNASPHLWAPLLPFGNILPTHLSHSGLPNNIQVRKLPIKVLGSAGSMHDEMPRSTKGLPEIVSLDWIELDIVI